MSRFWHHQLSGPTDPSRDAGWEDPPPRKGFFTDTSICIGCKACEVACKEWNQLPMDGDLQLLGSSYDNTGALGAATWRHVAFVEQPAERIEVARRAGAELVREARTVDLGMPSVRSEPEPAGAEVPDLRWLMSSDVCKHCTHAGCLDVCPTGALFRSEFGTVVVQDDVCNGCGYCVPACPFGVIDRREDDGGAGTPEAVGIAQKCTLCYDRLEVGRTPACAQACPTTSIAFGDLSEMQRLAQERVAVLHERGMTEARVYGGNERDGVGGTGSVFLLLDEPEVYGLPPDPQVGTARLPEMFRAAGWAGTAMLAAAAIAFGGRGR